MNDFNPWFKFQLVSVTRVHSYQFFFVSLLMSWLARVGAHILYGNCNPTSLRYFLVLMNIEGAKLHSFRPSLWLSPMMQVDGWIPASLILLLLGKPLNEAVVQPQLSSPLEGNSSDSILCYAIQPGTPPQSSGHKTEVQVG